MERPRVQTLTPAELVRKVLRGEVRIPWFQRGFQWEATDVVRLFDSVMRGFPVGALVMYRHLGPAQHLQVGPVAVDAGARESALWVVDGQQRITSLVGALAEAHRTTDTRFRVHLDLDTGEFHTAGPRQQPPPSWLPVSFLLDTGTRLEWTRENVTWLTEEQHALADRAADAFREYRIPAYVMPDEQSALEVFTRLNVGGKPLSRSEVHGALRSVGADGHVLDLITLGRVPAESGFGVLDRDLVRQSVAAFRGADPEGDVDLDPADGTLHEVAALLRQVVDFLRGVAGIPHVRALPRRLVVPVLVRFVQIHGAPEGRAATLLRRWVWRGAVTGFETDTRDAPRVGVEAIAAGDPVDSTRRLLETLRPFHGFHADLDGVHTDRASARLTLLGVLSAGPCDPTTGDAVDVGSLLDNGSPWQEVFPDVKTVANLIVMGRGGTVPVRHALATASPEIAASHLIGPEAQADLQAGRRYLFLRRRKAVVADVVERHVADMAEWGARDGHAIADLIRGVPR